MISRFYFINIERVSRIISNQEPKKLKIASKEFKFTGGKVKTAQSLEWQSREMILTHIKQKIQSLWTFAHGTYPEESHWDWRNRF